LDVNIAVEDNHSLREYTLIKQDLAAAIHDLRQFFHVHEMADGEDRCQALLVKLAEDRFNLAVLGQFKRGKSSLMNAIIGRDLLPTGVLPLTSVVTTLCYGPLERLLITRQDWTLTQELPLSDLADYVTERGNPGNTKGVLTAQVEVPIPFLRRGLHFIDTPGVGSASAANTATTYAFLPEADAVVFVTSVDAPLSETEESFLRDISQHAPKIFFVVNKLDLLGAAERSEVLGFVQTRLEQIIGSDHLHLYPVSARDALQAKAAADSTLLERSGLVNFEDALADFLAGEKSQVFLLALIDRALKLLAEAETTFTLEVRAAELPEETRVERLAELQQRLDNLAAALEGTLTDLRARLILLADERLTRPAAGLLQQHQTMLEARITTAFDQAASLAEFDPRTLIAEMTGALKSHQDQWLARQLGDLQPTFADVARPRLARAAATIDRAPGVTAEVFQITLPQSHSEPEPLDWPDVRRVGVKQARYEFEPSLLIDFLPGRLARPLLRRQLDRALQDLLTQAGEALREAWRQSIEAQVNEVARTARDRLKRIRVAIERRVSVNYQADGVGNPAIGLQLFRERFDRLRAVVLEGRSLLDDEREEIDRTQARAAIVGQRPALPHPPVTSGSSRQICPICAAQQEALFDFFAHWQYELSTKESARRDFAAAGGFCAVHTWQFQRIASPHGLSVGYAPLIETVVDQLKALSDQAPSAAAEGVAALIQQPQHCPACALLREVEQAQVDELQQRLTAPEAREAYRRSLGLCLPHLRGVLAADPPIDLSRFLIAEEARGLEATAENMRSYALKHAATRRWLENRDERTAYWRALTHLIGERNVRALWPDEE
jgi:GTP-binding protein EngB required for normal cell division